MIACLLVRCGSSVYDQKNLSSWPLAAEPMDLSNAVCEPDSKVVVMVEGMVIKDGQWSIYSEENV